MQGSFRAFAFRDVLNLKDEMRCYIVRVTHERYAIKCPDNFTIAMDVTLFNLTSRSFALQQSIQVRQVAANVVRMRDGLKVRLE